MERFVAFLRGINLGKRRPPMSQLKELFEEMGFDEVETFIASGNVLFSSKKRRRSELEARIAQQLEDSLGYAVDTFVRTAEEVVAIGKAKMFPEDGEPGVTIHVGFLHDELAPAVARKLTRGADGRGRVSSRRPGILLVVPGAHSRFQGVDSAGGQSAPVAQLVDAKHNEHPKTDRETSRLTSGSEGRASLVHGRAEARLSALTSAGEGENGAGATP